MWEKHTHTDALAAHNGFLYDTRFLSTNTLPITVYYYYYRKNRLGVSLYFSLQRKKNGRFATVNRVVYCVCVCVRYLTTTKKNEVSILFFVCPYFSSVRITGVLVELPNLSMLHTFTSAVRFLRGISATQMEQNRVK